MNLLPETCCFLRDSAASSWTYPVPAPSRDRPCCPCPSASDLRNGLQREYGWICGDYPRLTQNSCFFPIFPIARLPFPITLIHNSVHLPLSPSPLLIFVINWSDQHLDRCFLISRRVYIYQRTSSPSYKLERDVFFIGVVGRIPAVRVLVPSR